MVVFNRTDIRSPEVFLKSYVLSSRRNILIRKALKVNRVNSQLGKQDFYTVISQEKNVEMLSFGTFKTGWGSTTKTQEPIAGRERVSILPDSLFVPNFYYVCVFPNGLFICAQ